MTTESGPYEDVLRRQSNEYGLALKALGVDAPPMSSEVDLTAQLTRRTTSMLVMTLIDLYTTEANLRGEPVSKDLIKQAAGKLPTFFEKQVMSGSGTKMEQLLQALLRETEANNVSKLKK